MTEESYRKTELLSESYHLPLGAVPPYLCLWRRKFCITGGVLFVYCKADFKPSSMQAICLYLRKGQTVFSIYLFDLFSDLRIDAETEHIRLGRCHNVFYFGFLLT